MGAIQTLNFKLLATHLLFFEYVQMLRMKAQVQKLFHRMLYVITFVFNPNFSTTLYSHFVE